MAAGMELSAESDQTRLTRMVQEYYLSSGRGEVDELEEPISAALRSKDIGKVIELVKSMSFSFFDIIDQPLFSYLFGGFDFWTQMITERHDLPFLPQRKLQHHFAAAVEAGRSDVLKLLNNIALMRNLCAWVPMVYHAIPSDSSTRTDDKLLTIVLEAAPTAFIDFDFPLEVWAARQSEFADLLSVALAKLPLHDDIVAKECFAGLLELDRELPKNPVIAKAWAMGGGEYLAEFGKSRDVAECFLFHRRVRPSLPDLERLHLDDTLRNDEAFMMKAVEVCPRLLLTESGTLLGADIDLVVAAIAEAHGLSLLFLISDQIAAEWFGRRFGENFNCVDHAFWEYIAFYVKTKLQKAEESSESELELYFGAQKTLKLMGIQFAPPVAFCDD